MSDGLAVQIEAAIEAAGAALDAMALSNPWHSTDYAASEHGRFYGPNYSDRFNRAVCTCGRTFNGRSAFVSLGVHKQANNKKRQAALDGVWSAAYDAAMEEWRTR